MNPPSILGENMNTKTLSLHVFSPVLTINACVPATGSSGETPTPVIDSQPTAIMSPLSTASPEPPATFTNPAPTSAAQCKFILSTPQRCISRMMIPTAKSMWSFLRTKKEAHVTSSMPLWFLPTTKAWSRHGTTRMRSLTMTLKSRDSTWHVSRRDQIRIRLGYRVYLRAQAWHLNSINHEFDVVARRRTCAEAISRPK